MKSNRRIHTSLVGWIMVIISMALFTTGGYMIIISADMSNVASIQVTQITPVLNTFYVSLRDYYSGIGFSLIVIGFIPLILGLIIIVHAHIISKVLKSHYRGY